MNHGVEGKKGGRGIRKGIEGHGGLWDANPSMALIP